METGSDHERTPSYPHQLPKGTDISFLNERTIQDIRSFQERLLQSEVTGTPHLETVSQWIDVLFAELNKLGIVPPTRYGRALILLIKKESDGFTSALGANLQDIGPLQFIPDTAQQFFNKKAKIDQQGVEDFLDMLGNKDNTLKQMIGNQAESLTSRFLNHTTRTERKAVFAYLDSQPEILSSLREIDSRFSRGHSMYGLVSYQLHIVQKLHDAFKQHELSEHEDIFRLFVLNAHNTGTSNLIDKAIQLYVREIKQRGLEGMDALQQLYRHRHVGLRKSQKEYIFQLLNQYLEKEAFLLYHSSSTLPKHKEVTRGSKYFLASLLGMGTTAAIAGSMSRRKALWALRGGLIGLTFGPLLLFNDAQRNHQGPSPGSPSHHPDIPRRRYQRWDL